MKLYIYIYIYIYTLRKTTKTGHICCSVLLVHWALYQENFKYSCLNTFLSWIENVWKLLNERAKEKNPRNVKELWTNLKEEWEKISVDECQTLIQLLCYLSFPCTILLIWERKVLLHSNYVGRYWFMHFTRALAQSEMQIAFYGI